MSLKQKHYLRHELLDRLNSCLVMTEELVGTHMSVLGTTKAFTEDQRVQIKHHIDVAMDQLQQAYQRVGEIHL